jgi:hypothetical protein
MDEAQRRKLMEGFTNDIAAREARQEAQRKERDQGLTAKQEEGRALAQGMVTLTREQQSPMNLERKLQKEGMENLGRSPEDIVVGKRTDWDPNILNKK